MNEDVLFQELQGETVLLNLATGVYLGLDQIGNRIWQLLQEHGQLSEVVGAMVQEFEVREERCSQDLLALVEQLEAQGLIRIVPE